MDSIRLLIDFGSTYTKVVAVDLEREEVISAVKVPSTVDSDVTLGLKDALKQISDLTAITDLEKKEALACSSAAGGLRMVCVGFVPDLTSKAANHAALGAGAKVIGCFSFKLTRQEIAEIERISPDILLLCGGTDGGDEQVILHNAALLSRCHPGIHNIIVAGNKATYDAIGDLFKDTDKKVLFTRNVMPEIGVLDTEPCNKEIREIFLKNIIQAKGIAKVQSIIRDVIMPTPSAVLEAVKLMSNGSGDEPGLGELMVIDPGGATTDVHSIAKGNPSAGSVTLANSLPEPYVKRTVEGNLGLKHNIDTLRKYCEGRESSLDFDKIIERFCQGKLPEDTAEIACHTLLSRVAVEVAVNQHVGRLEVVYAPTGEMLVQHGKDFTTVKTVIGTGGPIIFSHNPREVLEGALFQPDKPLILKPRAPQFFLDELYILYAVGLLSQVEPVKALRIIKKHLKKI
jgi:uncharacterized protein (TIGR01319 family)